MRLAMVVCGVLLGTLSAQQLRWQVPAAGPSAIRYLWVGSFVDYDRDGYRDFLQVVLGPPPTYLLRLEIASGSDGAILWQQVDPAGYSINGRLAYAGDLDGDGVADLAIGGGGIGFPYLDLYSIGQDTLLWRVFGAPGSDFGFRLVGDIDVNGDGHPDVLASTYSSTSAEVFVYDTFGQLLYVVPCLAQGRYPVSMCKMGDLDGDGGDDFLIGCIDSTGRGCQWLVSGRTGSTIRETFGLLPGDQTAMHASNLGDIDGDGVDDYAAFPWYSSQRLIAVAYSGATGAVIRSWADLANSVVTGEDFDQDGVNDIVTGADWVLGSSLYGRTFCYSGRDGSELWRVDVVPFPPGTGSNGRNWMWFSASLGSPPGSPYPALAWVDTEWYTIGTQVGRVRVYDGARTGQGPVTGIACTSSGTLPLIGVRKLGVGAANTGFRTTVAKTHGNALAALNFAFTPLPTPVDLTPFGFAGCTLYLDPVATFLQVTGTTGIDRGYAAVDLPHPLSAAAVGTDVVAQWLVLEPSTWDHAATQMHAIRLP